MAPGSRTQHVESLERDDQGYGDSDSDRDQSKPARACQTCRASKVRCIQPDASQPCVRCEKGGRLCLPTEHPNKRQKRHDGRSIVELEATLAALTSTLQNRGRDASDGIREPPAATVTTAAPQFTAPAISRTDDSSEARPTSVSSSHSPKPNGVAESPLTCNSSLPASSELPISQIEATIGEIIDEDTADAVFEGFTANMLPEFPVVAFSPNTSARDIWKSTPITFLAILDVASDGFCELEVSRKLRKLLVQAYATCLLGTSVLSLPLLQALVISAAWHRTIEPAQPGEQMDVLQISHAAANMAIIMGLGKSLRSQTWSGPMPTQARRLRGPASQYQACSLDSRRIWLGCHYICSNTSMALQTPNIMRWTRYMDDCLEVLETSPASLPSDTVLCLHVRLQHILEDFESQLSTPSNGPTAAVVTHRASRRQLATWASAPRAWNDPLKFSQHFVTLYMHEIAMYSISPTDQQLETGGEKASNIDPSEFTDCLEAAHGLLDVFLSLDMSLIRALPTVYFVRLTYAAIVLVKLHFAAARLPDPRDAAQKTLSLKVDDYFGRMLQKFSGWGSLWPAWRLTKGLRRLRELFRQNSKRDMLAPEIAWLNLWSFKESSLNLNIEKANAPAKQAKGGTQSFQKVQQGTLEAHPLQAASAPVPAAQMLPTSDGTDLSWDLLNTDPGDTVLYAMQDTLPSMSLCDTSLWDTSQLDKWLDTNLNTSTFDFDGDLQSTIQFID